MEFAKSGSGSITVGYWTIRGLGAPLRAMVMYAGVPLNNVMYDAKPREDGSFDSSEWFSVKPEFKAKNALINLPYIVDGERIVSQTNACLSYLGRRLGLWGKTLDEQIDCEQLLCEIMDLRNTMTDFAYGSAKPLETTAITGLLNDVKGKNGVLQKLELWLQRKVAATPGTGAFLVGNSATAPDFHLHEMLVQYNAVASFANQPPVLTDYPHLAAFLKEFESLPGMQRYLQTLGKPGALPFNQKMAAFGADVSNGAWVQGTAYDFKQYEGVH